MNRGLVGRRGLYIYSQQLNQKKPNKMKTTEVTAEMYADYVRDTYGPEHYRKELEFLFTLLPDRAREELSGLVRADMVTRYETITAGLWGCDYNQQEAAKILRQYLANVNNMDISLAKDPSSFLDQLTTEKAEQVLSQSFIWMNSPEGSDYWARVSISLEK